MGISAVLFHTAWTGAYESFDTNPLIGAGLAHEFSDPQIRRSVVGELPVIRAFSGAYQWLNLAGFTINAELFESHFRFEGVGISCFWFSGSRFDSRSAEVPIQPQAPFGIMGLFKVTSTSDAGLLSAFWAAHIGFVSIPASCSQDPRPHLGENVLAFISKPVATSFRAASRIVQSTRSGLETPIVLTYNAGIDGLTQAFTFSDLGHHHLAIGSFLLLAGEAQRFLELLGLKCPWAGLIYGLQHHALPSSYTSAGLSGGSRRKDLYLSHSLMILRILSGLDSLLGSRIPVLPYLSLDSPTVVAVFLHHQWISGLLFLGAWAHLGIFFARSVQLRLEAAWISDSFCFRFSAHKSAIISHLSWVCLWLGFHTLGLYAHNDAVLCLGQDSKQVCLEPVLAGFSSAGSCNSTSSGGSSLYSRTIGLELRSTACPEHGFGTFPRSLGPFSLAGPADLLLAHALGLGLHTTSLIVLKGALNAPGTKLMPDKVAHGFAFPCDGPGRGGTCDISAWDSIYLAAFWMLNTVAWSEFTFHAKHLGTWNGSYIQFDLSSSSLNGWFRDYLWFKSAGLIRGYETTCSFDLAVLAWAFLLGHLYPTTSILTTTFTTFSSMISPPIPPPFPPPISSILLL